MKQLKILILIFALSLTFNCSEENASSDGSISLKFSANNSAESRASELRLNENVIITDFKISIRDVVFKNESDSDSSLDTDEIQFSGPYQIDLLDEMSPLTQTIGNVIVPDGLYKELRFKFHKDEDLRYCTLMKNLS